ncbi:hypothetical protein PEQA60_48960 [Pseudomonas sp. Eqa60]|nr:hypothetical protein PEQA60_48960 [Pseudomonas sp. Eqa60]
MTDAIELQREGGLLTLRLNRPDKKNALTRAMYARLADALSEADGDPEINAVMICGSSECFTAGNDIADFLQQPPRTSTARCFASCAALCNVASRWWPQWPARQ